MKLSDFLRMMRDDILCDIEFCTTVEQIVDTVKGSFDDAISAAKENGI